MIEPNFPGDGQTPLWMGSSERVPCLALFEELFALPINLPLSEYPRIFVLTLLILFPIPSEGSECLGGAELPIQNKP